MITSVINGFSKAFIKNESYIFFFSNNLSSKSNELYFCFKLFIISFFVFNEEDFDGEKFFISCLLELLFLKLIFWLTYILEVNVIDLFLFVD